MSLSAFYEHCKQGQLSEAQINFSELSDKKRASALHYLKHRYFDEICVLGHLEVAQWLCTTLDLIKLDVDLDLFMKVANTTIEKSDASKAALYKHKRTAMLEWIIEIIVSELEENKEAVDDDSIYNFMNNYIHDLCSDTKGYDYNASYKTPQYEEALIIIHAFIRHGLIDMMTDIIVYSDDCRNSRHATLDNPLNELFYQCCIYGYLPIAQALFAQYSVNIHYVSILSKNSLCVFEEVCRNNEFEVAQWLVDQTKHEGVARYELLVNEKVVSVTNRSNHKLAQQQLDANNYEIEVTTVARKKYSWSVKPLTT